jgi:hypothetical protein
VGVIAALALAGLVAWKLRPPPVEPLAALDAGTAPLAAVRDAGPAIAVVDTPDASVEEPDAGTAVAVVDPPDAGAPVDAGVRVVTNPGKRIGTLNVITTHAGEPWWAQVSIDGVPRGRTPLMLDLPVGKYQLRVERAGFRTEQREIKVASGKSTVLRIDLVP